MKLYYDFWDGESPIDFTEVTLTADEIIERFPFAKKTPAIVSYIDKDHYIASGFYSLSLLRANHNIDENLSNGEAMKVLEDIRNAPPPEIDPMAQPMSEGTAALLSEQLTEVELLILEGKNE